MPIENKKVKLLYDTMYADGKYDGSEDDFNAWFHASGEQGYQNRKQVWKHFHDNGDDVGATYEEFASRLGLHAVRQKPGTKGVLGGMVPKWKQRIENTKREVGIDSGAKAGEAKGRGTGGYKPTWQEEIVFNNTIQSAKNAISSVRKQTERDIQSAQESMRDLFRQPDMNRALDDAIIARERERIENPDAARLREAYEERDRIEARYRERMAEIDKEQSSRPWWQRALRSASEAYQGDRMGGRADVGAGSPAYDNDPELIALRSAGRKNKETITMMEDARSGKTNSFWHSLGTELTNGRTLSLGGLAGIEDARAIQSAAKHVDAINRKRATGEELTRDEQTAETVLENFALQKFTENELGNQYGKWARAGRTTAKSFGIMQDFIMTPGAWTLAKGVFKGVVKGGTHLLGKNASNLFAKYMLKTTGATLGSMAAGGMISNTIGIGRTMSDAGGRMQGDVYLDNDGNYVFGHYEDDGKGGARFVEGGDTTLDAIFGAERSAIAENGSEMLGEFLPGSKFILKGMEKVGLSKLASGLKTIGGKGWYQTYSNMLEKIGFHGTPGEVLEEYGGMGLDAIMGGDEWKSLADKRTHLDIILGCVTTGALLNAPHIAGSGAEMAQYYRYKHKTNVADRTASERMGEDVWPALRERIDGADNESVTDVTLDIIDDNNLTNDQRMAVMNYVTNLQRMRGYSLGMTQGADGASEDVVSMNRSFTSGYGITDEAEGNKLKQQVDDLRSELMAGSDWERIKGRIDSDPMSLLAEMRENPSEWTDETQNTVTEYVNAQMSYDGMQQRKQDDAEIEYTAKTEHLRGFAQREDLGGDGMLHPAVLRGDGRKVYIVSGNVEMLPDGGVNTQVSDKDILVRDEETGEIRWTTADNIDSLEEVSSVEEAVTAVEIVENAENAAQQAEREEASVRNRPDEVETEKTAENGEDEGTTVRNRPDEEERAEDTVIQQHTGQEEAMPMRMEKGREKPDWEKASPERAHTYIYNEKGLTREEADAFVSAMASKAEKDLTSKQTKAPKMATGNGEPDIDDYLERKASWQKEVDALRRKKEYWEGVAVIQQHTRRGELEARAAELEARAAERRAKDAVVHAEAVKAAETERAERKAAEASRKEVGNENPMPVITERWNNAEKIDGAADEMVLASGERVKGHYVLHESGASSPSHNPETWTKTDGFPMDSNDNSVNDRDYERDRDAQHLTEEMGRAYDQRALQTPVVVSHDGVVLSGNGRTMAGELAARDNTDGAYVDYLKDYAHKYGFTREQVSGMRHPRVSFVPDAAMPYTAETFAKFNQQEMKSQSKTEQAVKLGKTVSDVLFKRIVRTINGYDTLGEFYADSEGSLGVVYDLQRAGVLAQAQLAEMVDGVRGQEKLSAVGREFLENVLIGKAFDGTPDVVRMLTAEPSMRQTVITALGEIADNIALGDDWSLRAELADAVKLCYDARQGGAKYGEVVSVFARQGVLFADPDELQTVADFNNATMLMLADVLNDKRVTLLKTTLQLYNNEARESAAGQVDIFAGGIRSREDILRNVIKYINENYGKRKEIEAARRAAVERRKAESVQQDGPGGEIGGESEGEANGSQELRDNDRRGDSGSLDERQGGVSSSEEVDENGIPFVKSDDGTTNFGEIREDSGLTPAPIKLSQGYQGEDGKGYGLAHIEANHGEQIRNTGFASVEEFVRFVAQNYDEDNIRVGKRRENGNTTYLIQVTDEHDNTLFIEMSRDGSYWNVNSAGVFRRGYSNKKETVAKTEPQQPNNAVSTGSSLSADEESGITSAEPNGEPTVSESKDSENSGTMQGKPGKISVAEGQLTEKRAEEPLSADVKVSKAEGETETSPTVKQKAAGNYKKGHVRIDGYDFSIENPKGSERSGKDASGKPWSVTMQNTYGYIRGTEGKDGDHIDVFLSDHLDDWDGTVYVVDQVKSDGTFDEHKVMYGFNTEEEARAAYLSNYSPGWKGLGNITAVSKEEFRKWVDSSHRKTKAFAEYKSVRAADTSARNRSNEDTGAVSQKQRTLTDEERRGLTDEAERLEGDIWGKKTVAERAKSPAVRARLEQEVAKAQARLDEINKLLGRTVKEEAENDAVDGKNGNAETPAAETQTTTAEMPAPATETKPKTSVKTGDKLYDAYEREQGTVDEKGGLVKSDVAEKSLSKMWRGTLHSLGRRLGRRIEILSREEMERRFGKDAEDINGFFDKKTNTIYLNDIVTGNDARMRAFVAGHEITHILKAENADLYKSFVEAVKKALGSRFQEIFDSTKKDYDNVYDSLGMERMTDDGIIEEICCDYAGSYLLTDATAIRSLMESAGTDARSIARKVLDWISDRIAYLKTMVTKGLADANELAAMEDAKKIWEEMYRASAEKAETSASPGTSPSPSKGGEEDKEEAKEFHHLIDKMFGDTTFDPKPHYREHYNLGGTPDWMRKVGIRGDYFTLSFKNIRTHVGKDKEHDLTKEEWHQFPQALKSPFALTRYKDDPTRFRLYVNIIHQGNYVAVGVDVIPFNQGKGKPIIEINRIKTVFGHRGVIGGVTEELIAYDEKITPEQEALLRELNFHEYPTIQELSASKDNTNLSNLQEKEEKSSEDIRFSVSSKEDKAYVDAVKSGDIATAMKMLREKALRTGGITPYIAPHGYGGSHAEIAKKLKTNEGNAVVRAVADMQKFVPGNAVLVPMPPHEGKVSDDTDTMILADALSVITGAPVSVALEGAPRESRYAQKMSGKKGLKADEMGFKKIADIPEGKIPIIIDNVVGSGETAKAAVNALGGGITLAYAKGTRSGATRGLKNATITYDDNGNLIPLSERFNKANEDIRFSIGRSKPSRDTSKLSVGEMTLDELDKEYMQALSITEKPARIEKLRNSENATIKGTEIPFSEDIEQFRKNALRYGKDHIRGSYRNNDTGALILVSNSKHLGGLREILEHDYKDVAHLQSVAAIPQIIEKSIFIDSIGNEDKENHPQIEYYDYYVCGLKIGDEDYTVKAVIANTTDGVRYYDHKLTQIEKGKLLDELALSKASASSGLSSVASQGDAVAGHPATESRETIETPISKYKDKRLISILQINKEEISSAESRMREIIDESKRRRGYSDDSEKDIRLSIGRRKTKRELEREQYALRQWDRAHELAKDWIEKLKIGDVATVYDSVDDIPEGVKVYADKKGWYDEDAKKITIVMNNHNSPQDVLHTILREAVARHGMRELFGGHYDTFLDNVWTAADTDVKHGIMKLTDVEDASARTRSDEGRMGRNGNDGNDGNDGNYGNDVARRRLATEEYLAELAENTDFERGTIASDGNSKLVHWFHSVKEAFLEMLNKLGLNGLYTNFTFTDNELRYMLWRSYKNLTEPGVRRNPWQVAEDIVLRQRLQMGDFAKTEGASEKAADGRNGKNGKTKDVSAIEALYNKMKASHPDALFLFRNADGDYVCVGKDMAIINRVLRRGSNVNTILGEDLELVLPRLIQNGFRVGIVDAPDGRMAGEEDVKMYDGQGTAEPRLTEKTDGEVRFSVGENEMSNHIIDVKKKHNLKGGAIHQVTGGREDIDRLRGVVPESDFEAIIEGYENPDVKGVHLPNSHVIVLFSERIDDYDEGIEIWSHEQAHEFFDTLPKEDQERLGKMCFDWLRYNATETYQKVINEYDKDDWDTEACAYFISETVKWHGLDKFMSADFAGDKEIAKFADEYRKFIINERQGRKETSGDRLRQSENHDSSIKVDGRGNQGREDESKEKRAGHDGESGNGITSNSTSPKEDIRYSVNGIGAGFTERDRVLARDAYERMVSSRLSQFREAVQDSMLSLKQLYEAVLKAEASNNGQGTSARNRSDFRIEDVADFENAYLAENRMSSMSSSGQHRYYNRYMKPLLAEIHRLCKDNGGDRDTLGDYMLAKHGLERNLVLADRDAREAEAKGEDYNDAYQKCRERDYAGLTALTGMDDLASAEAEAQRMVDDYERDHDTRELWRLVKDATEATLAKIYRSGQMSKETYDKVRGMFDYYIPLRGWDEKTSDEVYGYLTGHDGPLYGSVMKRAGGRRSKADDPIATIGMMADSAIMKGNRNLMKQRFLNFVLNHPSDAVSVSDLWLRYNDITDEWEPVFPDLDPNDTAADVDAKVKAFEQQMQQLSSSDPDHYKRSHDGVNVPYKVVNQNMREHQVIVERAGRRYVLTINGNPRAAQALNGLTNPDVEMGGGIGNLMRGAEWLNRQLSAFYTTRNPDFVASNFLRDMLYSNVMSWVKEDPAWAWRFNTTFFRRVTPRRLFILFSKWENGTLNHSDHLEHLFHQFMENGGETGYTNVKDLEGHKRTVTAELRRQGNSLRAAASELGHSFDHVNRTAENVARFSAFVTSMEMGRGVARSIWDAKEISVNFNKKGSGGKMVNATGQTTFGKVGGYIGDLGKVLYVFWNAGVQGMTNFGRALYRNPRKGLTMGASAFLLGALVSSLGKAFGGDDDDKDAYFNLPEYIRRTNIIFRAPWGKDWISIPLPIELRALYGLGELAGSVCTGGDRYDSGELAWKIAGEMSQVLPLDLLEGGGGASNLLPSYAKPVVEALTNRSWTGLPIYRKNEYNEDDPNWTKAYSNANTWLVSMSRWINEATGGDDYKKGALSPNPAQIEYILSGYFGGAYSVIDKLVKMGETAVRSRDFEWRNMLILNRVVKTGDERTEARRLTNEYFKYKDEWEEVKRLEGKYEKASEGDSKYAKKLEELRGSNKYTRYQVFDAFDPILNAVHDAMKGADDKTMGGLKAAEVNLRREMIDLMHDFDDGKVSSVDEVVDETLKSEYNSGGQYTRKAAAKSIAKRLGGTDSYGSSDSDWGKEYERRRSYTDLAEDILLLVEQNRAKEAGDEAREKTINAWREAIRKPAQGMEVRGGDTDVAARNSEIMERVRELRKMAMESLGIMGVDGNNGRNGNNVD